MVGSILVISAMTHALLHFVCDLKAAQMKMQHCLIRELNKFNHNAGEAIKNSCVKGEGAVDHSTVTR